MKKRLAGALLLLFTVNWAPLSPALMAAGSGQTRQHRCCPRLHPQILVQMPPSPNPCGPGHQCCVSSDRPATLRMRLPLPSQNAGARNFVSGNRFAVSAELKAAEGPSPLPPRLRLSMIFRI